jgi:hypothetical protein
MVTLSAQVLESQLDAAGQPLLARAVRDLRRRNAILVLACGERS